MKALLIILLLFTLSCTTKKGEAVFSIRQHAIDSFRLVNFIDTRELFNLTYLNDSERVAFSYSSQHLCRYKRKGYDFVRSDSFFIPNSFHFIAFFTDRNKKVNLIGRDSEYAINKWYEYNLEQRKIELKRMLSVNLPVLKQFRIFHLQNQPVMMNNGSFVLGIAAIDPFTFVPSLKEKVYLRVDIRADTISETEQFQDKPASVISQIMPYDVHCCLDSKILTVFPCIDSIYIYDLATKKSERTPICNPNFSPPLPYDHKRWMEADYNTEIRVNSFYYQGIFFNKRTKHIVLFYTTPADKDIKVPTDEDKQFYALVVDTNYQFVKNVRFTDEFWSPVDFFNTEKGIYMPHYTKKVRDEKKCTYYLFDL